MASRKKTVNVKMTQGAGNGDGNKTLPLTLDYKGLKTGESVDKAPVSPGGRVTLREKKGYRKRGRQSRGKGETKCQRGGTAKM